jgi:hypothetical protein
MKRRICAVLVTAALAGCGTGGGGGGGPSGPVSPPVSDSSSPPSSDSSSPPASFEFPTLATVSGGEVRVSSAITSRSHEHFRDRVSASADGAGNFTFRVNDPNVGVYSFTVNLPPNTSISSSGERPDFAFTSLDYSAAGAWAHLGFPGGNVGGAGAVGVATGRADLPTTGTATYSGAFIGRQIDIDGERALVEANARSAANFGTGVVSFETTNSRTRGGIADPTLDLVGSMTFQSSGGVRQNSLRGPVSTKSGGMTGEVRGNFFGPASSTSAPPELGGSVAVRSSGATVGAEGRSMIGGFVMKR